MLQNFEHSEKIGKKIRKASKVSEYLCEVDRLFRECDLRAEGAGGSWADDAELTFCFMQRIGIKSFWLRDVRFESILKAENQK